ncbi:hypothetical protein Tco_0053432 [Tanacetum coccineum]
MSPSPSHHCDPHHQPPTLTPHHHLNLHRGTTATSPSSPSSGAFGSAFNSSRKGAFGSLYSNPKGCLVRCTAAVRAPSGGVAYTKVKVLGADEILRTRDNVAAMRARLMEKMAHEENAQAKT